MRDYRFCPGLALPAAALLLATATLARADLIYFKDGFTLHGKVVEQRSLQIDSLTKESWILPKGIYIDDGPRRFFFGYGQMQAADNTVLRPEDRVGTGRYPRGVILPQVFGIPIMLDVVDPGTFNEEWNRTYVYRTVGRDVQVPEHLMTLTSYYAHVAATKYFLLNSYYLTQELGCDQVRKLLKDNPAFKDSLTDPAAKRAERRFRLYRFLMQAGWYNEASEELDAILRDLPAQKKKVEEERERLTKLQVQRHFEDLQRAHRAGRHHWVQEQIPNFREKYASQKAVDEVRAFRRTFVENEKKMDEVRTLLDDLLKRVRGEEKIVFSEAVTAIRAELHHDTIGRLDAFVRQARQAARLAKSGSKVEETPSQLLALAVTGWLLGGNSAEARAETARKLWTARKMVLAYLQTNNDSERTKVLADFASAKNALSVDEVEQVISLLPPPLAEETLPQQTVERKVDGMSYLLQLPPEYHHGRAYPLLIVLHNAGETPKKMLARFAEKAKEEGYILAAPDWLHGGFGGGYTFSADQHEVVLKALRDLRLHYNVDSDRVFLFGLGEGGDMAYDVGLSHPDLFAGVLPMSADPRYFIVRYWANAQYLPLYIVGGDHTGAADSTTRKLFEKWVPHNYPALYVQYKGRGREWFGGELPYMFDWMSRKRRNTPITHLGRSGGELGDEFTSMRATDDRFYWLSGRIFPRHINRFPETVNRGVPRWSNLVIPATLDGRIDPGTNQIFINQRGYQKITVWLARDSKVDFDKELTVRINGALHLGKKRARPSLKVLLDDFLTRGDRQKLFIAKFEFTP